MILKGFQLKIDFHKNNSDENECVKLENIFFRLQLQTNILPNFTGFHPSKGKQIKIHTKDKLKPKPSIYKQLLAN